MDEGAISDSTDKEGDAYYTHDLNALARAVEKPEIAELISLDSGKIIDAVDFVQSFTYDDLITQRSQIMERRKSNPILKCAICHTPVYLVSSPQKRFFFRHTVEDGSCPAKTRGDLSREEIQARKYHGQKESEAHKRVKRLIERSLNADQRFFEVKSEKQWRSYGAASSRRQPDVQVNTADGRLAFEVQLSTTFLDVVIGRRVFYRDEGALLIWVLAEFDHRARRLTTDDLLVPNNSNVLVVDEETTEISEETNYMHVRCHYRRPVRDGYDVRDQWEEEVVRFDELTREPKTQRIWLFDYDTEVDRIRSQIEAERDSKRSTDDDALRKEFLAFWKDYHPHNFLSEEEADVWRDLRTRLGAKNIDLPEDPVSDSELVALMIGIVSAQVGKPVGWSFTKLVAVAHKLGDSYPKQVFAFGYAIRHFKREHLLKSQDRRGKWQKKAAKIKEAYNFKGEQFVPDGRYILLARFVCPPVGEGLEKLKKRASRQSLI